ncbi:MAG: hypothetical protein BJ554DRAFT_6002 [Olpidium bornovanus]|uniref:Peptidase M20 dimerisation domain-containing protein n=1 Tax=Olpidium bornovanus TaxID=278681 RepID=A0A8H8DL14_9FUNG|nr:MAG: hypothetical protein BJ554DRAFT_6002 [Olpidium bornovanus]
MDSARKLLRRRRTLRQTDASASAARAIRMVLNACAVVFALGAVIQHSLYLRLRPPGRKGAVGPAGTCPQTRPLLPPERRELDVVFERLFRQTSGESEDHRRRVADNLGALVSIAGSPIARDRQSREEAFRGLHGELERRYPLVHEHFQRETIANFSLLYYFPGSDSSLLPILLTAHLDVVPVVASTIDEWRFDPFSGKVEDGYIWGRGAVDDKRSVVAIMEAMELLLESGFREPTRGILLGFGHDEELGGMAGARAISWHLVNVKGITELFLLIDEGTPLVELNTDAAANLAGAGVGPDRRLAEAGRREDEYTTFAMVGTAEKGKMTAAFRIETGGGHVSNPPLHTSVGLMSLLINRIEADPFPAGLSEDNSVLGSIECLAAHLDLSRLSLWERFLASHARRFRSVVAAYLTRRLPDLAHNFRTTTAVTVFRGGVAANVVPRSANATVNFRIAVELSLAQVRNKIIAYAKSFAEEHDLEFTGDDADVEIADLNYDVTSLRATAARASPHQGANAAAPAPRSPSYSGTLRYSARPGSRDPSPVAPPCSDAYRLLAGTIRGVFGRGTVVTPALLPMNTDSWHYLPLTRNAFRFTPVVVRRSELPPGFHDVNEVASVAGLHGAVGFFFQFVRNAAGGGVVPAD